LAVWLTQIDILVVPADELRARSVPLSGRQAEGGAVEGAIAPPVTVVFPDAPAHLEVVVGRHRQVALVEEPVQVRPEQDPVADVVGTVGGEWPDVCGVRAHTHR
jgi:hypothetical protein